LSQHVALLTSYSEKLAELDEQQKAVLEQINEANTSLKKDAQTRLDAMLPEITEQERVMMNIGKRVSSAKRRLEEQGDTVYFYQGFTDFLVGGYRLQDCGE